MSSRRRRSGASSDWKLKNGRTHAGSQGDAIADASGALRDKMSRTCPSGHRHVHSVGGRPKDAARYPQKFCDKLASAVGLWMCRVGQMFYAEPLMGFERGDLVEPAENELIEKPGLYWDDLRDVELCLHLAKKARQEELAVFRERGVCEVVPRGSATRSFKLIGILSTLSRAPSWQVLLASAPRAAIWVTGLVRLGQWAIAASTARPLMRLPHVAAPGLTWLSIRGSVG